MAEINDLSFETDEVTAAEDTKDSIFTEASSVVSFVKHDEEDLYKITIGHNPKIIVYWMHLH